jgi:hypothetical protein
MRRYCFVFLFLQLSGMLHSNAQQSSIRFYGNGVSAPDQDRIKIAITSSSPVNVAYDFTLECWIKCNAANNNGVVYNTGDGNGWITGNIIIDRDVYGNGDTGDYGLAIGTGTGVPSSARVVAFGIDRLGTGITIRGNTNVANNNWHHIAVTRNSTTGVVRLYVDGNLDATGIGPTGNINYNTGRSTSYPNSDPYIVLGAEKHDAGSSYPSYNGLLDELRISSVIRYTGNFTPPGVPFTTDANTLGLYHFDEGTGTVAGDVSGAAGGPSNGILQAGGSPVGPVWTNESPFTGTLDINWISFTGEKKNHNIILRWTTTPDNTSGNFEVQKSANGNQFEIFQRLSAGNTCNGSCKYSLTDYSPYHRKNYYRIRYESQTGEATYSKVVLVYFDSEAPFKVFQNGTYITVQTHIKIDQLIIWSSDGKRIYEKRNLGEGSRYIPIGMNKGVLFLHILMEDGSIYTKKLIVPY